MTDVPPLLRERRTSPDGASSAEARLQGLLALSTEAIISTDQSQRIMLFNRGAEEVFGYSAAEILGEPLSALLPSMLGAWHREVVNEMLGAGDHSRRMAERRPVRGRRKNGEEFEALVSIGTHRSPGGMVATAILRDVSELRAAERALHESERRHRTLVDASPAGILSVSTDGTVLQSNPAFARMLGFPTVEAVRGMGIAGLFVERDAWARIVCELRDRSHYVATEHLMRCSDDAEERSVLLKALRVETSPEEEDQVHLIALDVTARRQLEETVRRTEQLDLIGRLAGGVAHDFNNLLLVIRMSASMLAEESGLSPQGRLDLNDLEKAAIRAGELTQQLLAFGRRQVMRPATLDLGQLVDRQAPLLRRLLGEDVSLRTSVGRGSVRVMADEAQLERVLANLATNARDAMPTGGMVRIVVECRDPSDADRALCAGLTDGAWVHLGFSDSGGGMDAATLSRIFDPFYTTKEVGRGTGLGLASVYGIVTQSGGCIGVESTPGDGTSFHLWFPLAEPTTAESVRIADPGPDHAIRFALPLTVLLIEDEHAVRAGVRRVLADRGITVLEAADARSAILRIAAFEGPIHAIVSDIVLPGLSGQRAVDWIAQRYPDAKVLFISGYSPETADHRGTMRAGSAFLAKPFAPEDLLRMLAGLLNDR